MLLSDIERVVAQILCGQMLLAKDERSFWVRTSCVTKHANIGNWASTVVYYTPEAGPKGDQETILSASYGVAHDICIEDYCDRVSAATVMAHRFMHTEYYLGVRRELSNRLIEHLGNIARPSAAQMFCIRAQTHKQLWSCCHMLHQFAVAQDNPDLMDQVGRFLNTHQWDAVYRPEQDGPVAAVFVDKDYYWQCMPQSKINFQGTMLDIGPLLHFLNEDGEFDFRDYVALKVYNENCK